MTVNNSPNMNLPIPVVGNEPGPTWASDLNNSLTLIDAHNHSTGSGVQITPSGMNINSALPLNNNNLTLARSLRLSSQGAPLALAADIGCLYEVGVDLYYNDGSGNQIRITQSGAVAGTPGSISSLTSPASASYNAGNQTFVWQSDANTPANMDFGSAILRNIVANSKGLTLAPPNAMAADYTLVLPALPAAQHFVSLDAAGNFGSAWVVDNSTVEISSNNLRVKDGGITPAKLSALGQQISSSSGAYINSTSTDTQITNLSVTITTTGRPVMILCIPDGTANPATIGPAASTAITDIGCRFSIYRDSSAIAIHQFDVSFPSGGFHTQTPVSSVATIDVVTAGSHTYQIFGKTTTSNTDLHCEYVKLAVYEL